MLTRDMDMAMEVASAIHRGSGEMVTYKGEQIAIKDLSFRVANTIAEILDDMPGTAVALALGALVGSTAIRLTDTSNETLENQRDELIKRGVDVDNVTVPDPYVHALAIGLLAKRYVMTVQRVDEASEQLAEHVENGGKLS